MNASGESLTGWVRGWRAPRAVQIADLCWLLAAGCWLLGAGRWLSAAGCWLLAAGALVARGLAITASLWQLLRLSVLGVGNIEMLMALGN